MRTGSLIILVIVLLLGFFGCSGVSTYNSLVGQEETVNQEWGNVQSQYQRRADLIPNLVETVKGAADFERETLDAVVNARAQATSIQISADDLQDPEKLLAFQQAQSALGQSLGRLMAIAESYPELRAVESYRDLQVQLEGTENRIAVARNRYNEAVTAYNTDVRSFPASIFASMFGFERKSAFQADAGSDAAPKVDF